MSMPNFLIIFTAVAILSLAIVCDCVSQKEFDCPARRLAYNLAVKRLENQVDFASAKKYVFDSLRLEVDCNDIYSSNDETENKKKRNKKATRTGTSVQRRAVNSNNTHIYFHAGTNKDKQTLDEKPGFAFNTLAEAVHASRLHIYTKNVTQKVIVLHPGWYSLNKTLVLSAEDSGLTIEAAVPGAVIISGAIQLKLNFTRLKQSRDIYKAQLPETNINDIRCMYMHKDVQGVELSSPQRVLRSARRLPWAREPNGDVEFDLQPTGWAAAAGRYGPLKPTETGSFYIGSDRRISNSSIYTFFGRDLDPRETSGWQWLHLSGTSRRFGDNINFFNGSVPSGMHYNDNPSKDRAGNFVSGFNASGWTKKGYKNAIVHIFHSSFWGNWIYSINNVSFQDKHITFDKGGWQEAHGGDIRDQPFYVEGVREALDSPDEWWIDEDLGELFLIPNVTDSTDIENYTFSAPKLKSLVRVDGASDVKLLGLTFALTAPTYLEEYVVPSPGDWSVHRNGAVSIERSVNVQIKECSFVRVGGNGLHIGRTAKKSSVIDSEFFLIGDSAIATIGQLNMYDGFSINTYPEETLIKGSHFHEIGVTGKQASALFSALSCKTKFVSNVLYNGPRAGININDAFCHGHFIKDNVIFNWVRETQDHGPINTWNRAAYIQRGEDDLPTSVPMWTHISNNFIMNGPSGNRDLGNLFPTIDNDDGSSYFSIEGNVLLYGGFKNYLGQDKRWVDNLIIFPERWSGDPCAQLWGGEKHFYVNNTCVTNSSSPIGLDGTTKGFKCKIDWNSDQNLRNVAFTANNSYFMNGNWSLFCGNATSANHRFSLSEMKSHGFSLGSRSFKLKDLSPHDLTLMVGSIVQ